MPAATQGQDVLYRTLEAESAAIAVYEAAIACASDAGLGARWARQRDAKEASLRELREALRALALDPEAQTPSRHVLRHVGQSLACAVKVACQSVAPAEAELVAAECIVHAQASCRHHWMLAARVARAQTGEGSAGLRALAAAAEAEQRVLLEDAQRTLAERSLAAVGLPGAPGDIAAARCDEALPPVRLRANGAGPADRPPAWGTATAR